MKLTEFVQTNRDRIIERWKTLVVERLAFDLSRSELLDDLPELLGDLSHALYDPHQQWPAIEVASKHGLHRLRVGIDMGALTEEMAIITEVICALRHEDGDDLSTDEMRTLVRVMGRGTAASVRTYMAARDRELERQSGEHFFFIAHEIRTPLQSARLATTLLASSPEGQRDKYVARLQRALVELAALVDNFLVQIRLSGEPHMCVQRFGSVQLLKAACDDVVDHAAARGLTLEVQVEEFDLDIDWKLMRSALGNLLENAVKFTCEGSVVTLRAAVLEGRALFEVEDQCGGMPEELPAKLFQPFVQANTNKNGFGLGLMIVKQAVEAHGGAVRVNNRPDEGCTFVMDIPRRQREGARRVTRWRSSGGHEKT